MTPPSTTFWCAACESERKPTEVVFYFTLGRMCLVCRSGKVLPLTPELRQQLADLAKAKAAA